MRLLVGRRSVPAYVSCGGTAASGPSPPALVSLSCASAAMSASGPKLAICQLGLILAIAPIQAAKTTDDYLQPYKFVKPLKDLEELYSKHAPAAESRSDTVTKEEVPSKLEKKILMTDELEVPDLATGDETLPRAQPLRDLKGRTRTRTSASDSKARLDNHKTDEDEDEVVEADDELEALLAERKRQKTSSSST